MPEYTFKNPPAHEVTASVQFLNNLRVADDRQAFHRLIREEFPVVVMPELKSLSYDFGDYTLYTENLLFRLEVSMNYFRLVSSPYPGFASFGPMFMNALAMFSTLYEVENFGSFTLRYSNNLPVEPELTFEDYFGLEITIPGSAGHSKLWAGQGTVAIQEADGRTFIEFEPQFTDEVLSSYKMNLTFTTNESLTAMSNVERALHAGHEHLRRYFFACLKPEYLEVLSHK